MQDLKKEVDDASAKVDQCEGLVNKLENEIIEWDALKKLCRRDEELGEIDKLLDDFEKDIAQEAKTMGAHLDKQSAKLDQKPDDKDAAYLIEGINNYLNDIDKLGTDVNYMKEEKDDCFEEFDEDVPTPVKEARNRRLKSMFSPKAGKKAPVVKEWPTASDKPRDMYYMLSVNKKYRQRIHDMLKNLRAINQKRRDLEEKYGPLKRDLNVVKEVQMYKAVKGDAIDELWAYHLNQHQLALPVKRLGVGSYMFGTRKIMAKIINGKLVIRVGGGYMSADEFIEQYGKMEMLKMMENERRQNDPNWEASSAGRRGSMTRKGSMPRMSAANVGSIADMKDMMKAQLDNVSVYEDRKTNTQFDDMSKQPRSPGPRKTNIVLADNSLKTGISGRSGSAGRSTRR